jgi:cytochrome P450
MGHSASITVDGIELGDVEFWKRPLEERDAAFATLRRECPVSFHKELTAFEGQPQGPGFWSITRYEDVREVNRRAKTFSSADGITTAESIPEALEFFGSMIVLDDPRHAKMRLLVQKGFTPREVTKVEQSVRQRAKRLVADAMKRRGETIDFVEHFAAPLPLQVICDMLGIPEADERQIFEWTNVILGAGDPEYGESVQVLLDAAMGMYNYANALGQDRLRSPKDDITSVLMHAEVDGERLTLSEFGSFFILLAVAGNETTRNAISHGMVQLSAHKDQLRAWQADFGAKTQNAVEEIVRFASPVIHMRRLTTEDTVIGGHEIPAGEKVAMWYCSANRDERVFENPHVFDIERENAKEQVGYGAGGPHFCLGANLARREISVMFEELFTNLPDLEITGEPERLLSSFINGIKRVPCTF